MLFSTIKFYLMLFFILIFTGCGQFLSQRFLSQSSSSLDFISTPERLEFINENNKIKNDFLKLHEDRFSKFKFTTTEKIKFFMKNNKYKKLSAKKLINQIKNNKIYPEIFQINFRNENNTFKKFILIRIYYVNESKLYTKITLQINFNDKKITLLHMMQSHENLGDWHISQELKNISSTPIQNKFEKIKFNSETDTFLEQYNLTLENIKEVINNYEGKILEEVHKTITSKELRKVYILPFKINEQNFIINFYLASPKKKIVIQKIYEKRNQFFISDNDLNKINTNNNNQALSDFINLFPSWDEMLKISKNSDNTTTLGTRNITSYIFFKNKKEHLKSIFVRLFLKTYLAFPSIKVVRHTLLKEYMNLEDDFKNKYILQILPEE